MLTLDGTVAPMLNGGSGMGAGAGTIGGLLAGAVGGALAGSVLGNRNNGWGGGNYGGGVGAPAVAAVATDIVLNPAFQSIQHQIDSLSGQVGTNTVLEAVRHIDDQIAGYNTNTQNLIGNVATAQAAANFTTLSSVNGLGRDLQASATQALINNLQNFNQLQNAQQTATNLIIAGQNAQNTAQAACCCDIKQLIQSDGSLTRTLINDLNVQNLRDMLATANGKVSNNEQNQYLLNTILTHLKPATAVF